MKNARKFLAVIIGVALLLGAMSVTTFAATTGTGVEGDPIICETLEDLPGTYTVEAGGKLWFSAPVGGQIISVTDPDGAVQFMHPMTWMPRGTEMDYTNLPDGEYDDICVMNDNPTAAVEFQLVLGKLGGDEEGGDVNIGTEKDPLVVEYNPSFMAYLMNDSLEAGDTDGIWYQIEAHKDGVMYVDVNCYDEVDYTVNVMIVGSTYQGVNFEGNPIITYRVKAGDVITIHKYVEGDLYGNIPAANILVSATIVDATEDDPVSIKTEEIRVPVASGDTIALLDQSRNGVFCGKGLIVSGYAEAIKLATITVDGVEYKDVDGDGTIELNVPGDAMTRSKIFITNGHEWDIAFTFTVVESAEEGEPAAIAGDINGDTEINNNDVVALMWHVLFPEEYPIDAVADVNADGEINNSDVVALMWHVLFPEEYPLG